MRELNEQKLHRKVWGVKDVKVESKISKKDINSTNGIKTYLSYNDELDTISEDEYLIATEEEVINLEEDDEKPCKKEENESSSPNIRMGSAMGRGPAEGNPPLPLIQSSPSRHCCQRLHLEEDDNEQPFKKKESESSPPNLRMERARERGPAEGNTSKESPPLIQSYTWKSFCW